MRIDLATEPARVESILADGKMKGEGGAGGASEGVVTALAWLASRGHFMEWEEVRSFLTA